MTAELPRYDRTQTYRWNYEHAPETAPEIDVPPLPDRWTFCDFDIDSPLGIPAGPLLNGRWVLYYAALGFDVLTYKTVRSGARECYPLPNLQPVDTGPLQGGNVELSAIDAMQGSWAVSFGMPSAEPDVWRADVEQTRKKLPTGKVLSVSVVGTVRPEWSIDDLAADYARCAQWAIDSGADCIEANLSCPNVSTCDGQLYQQPAAAALVAAHIRGSIGETPLLLKIGHLTEADQAVQLLEAVAPHVAGLAMTNSVAATVRDSAGQVMFAGDKRGICGDATFEASLAQTALFSALCRERGWNLNLVGVGGVSDASRAQSYLDAGAHAVHIATATMTDPLIACRIRRQWAAEKS